MHSSVLVLLSHLTVALCCDSLTQYSHYSSISLKLVDNMGGQLSGQDPPVYFPYRLYRRIRCSREERQLSFVRESLELIFDLYRTNNTYPATWEKNTIQHFLISLERLMDTLDQCVSNKYQCVTNEYNSTHGSSESWKFVMSETKTHLEQLHLLVSFIQFIKGARCSRLH
uniref:Uncharacterized protein n=1 Tax=Cynoglossus semilaevis TaxID=244447 RepID=A0A3P8VGZ9_CYNSE